MTEKRTHFPDDQQIRAALTEKLDQVAPRRDLWPAIQAELLRQRNHRKWWQLPYIGPLVNISGQAPALRLTSISVGSVAVVLLLAWLVLLPPGQDPFQDVLARNVRGYWYDYASGPVAGSGAVTYAAFFQSTGDNPIINTDHNQLCSFAVNVDTMSYAEGRDLVLSAGRLPDAASVRLEGFINFFDHGYQPPTEGPFAIHIEGAPSPFGGENQWLLRIGLQARDAGAGESAPDSSGMSPVIARNVKAWVEFNPQVVSTYRQLGYEYQRVAYDDFPTSTMIADEVRAGHSVTALFEVSFREGFPEGAQGRIATVHAEYQDPDPGAKRKIMRGLNSSDLELTFEQTTPYFQRDAVVAEYAEVLRESHWAQDSGLEQVQALAQRVSASVPNDPAVAEFADLVARAEQVARKNAS